MSGDDYASLRERMVRADIRGRGIRNERVLSAFRTVPRERFVPKEHLREAYGDHPVQIGYAQTVSQPYIVALMMESMELSGGERVLEIGTGSGYQTALLAEICAAVYTVERLPQLAESARRRLDGMGYANVYYRLGDGTLGWPEEAPFDGIVVSASAPRMPAPLKQQLTEGGRLVIPVVDDLLVIERREEAFHCRHVCGCRFVKLIGREGWADAAKDER